MKNEKMEKKTQIILMCREILVEPLSDLSDMILRPTQTSCTHQRFPEYQVPHQAERDFTPSSKYSHTQGTEEG